jgi:hypothetical protein
MIMFIIIISLQHSRTKAGVNVNGIRMAQIDDGLVPERLVSSGW